MAKAWADRVDDEILSVIAGNGHTFDRSLRDFQSTSDIYKPGVLTLEPGETYEGPVVDMGPAKVLAQSRLESAIETGVNIGTGFFISWAVWVWVAAPLFGIPVHFAESLGLTALFTITSVARSYFWRRFFNKRYYKWLASSLSTLLSHSPARRPSATTSSSPTASSR